MASFKANDASGRAAGLADFEAPDGLVAVAVFADYTAASEAGLAVLAMGAAYWMIRHESGYVLCVAAAREAAVRRELSEFAAMASRRRTPRTLEYREFAFGWLSFALFAALLIACFVWQQHAPIVERGRVDAVAMVEQGQWWRAVTALTLHADLVHMLSNLLAGAGFAFFVCRFFSAALGWLLILLSGIAGNALNAQVHFPATHHSLGASTAVFGALGLLTGVGLWAALSAPDERLLLPRWLLPLFAGLTLLGLLGLGDEHVDVAAHLSGFLCGLVLGTLAAGFQRLYLHLQGAAWALAGVSGAIVVVAWCVALAQ
jgi:rhomboid protease GluP